MVKKEGDKTGHQTITCHNRLCSLCHNLMGVPVWWQGLMVITMAISAPATTLCNEGLVESAAAETQNKHLQTTCGHCILDLESSNCWNAVQNYVKLGHGVAGCMPARCSWLDQCGCYQHRNCWRECINGSNTVLSSFVAGARDFGAHNVRCSQKWSGWNWQTWLMATGLR